MLAVDSSVYTRVHRIVFSQIVTGEAVGVEHYARMIPLATSLDERMGLLDDAWHEGQHLRAVQRLAASMELPVDPAVNDPYWGRVQAAFNECAERKDLAACYLIQDVVLECFAITLYRSLAPLLGADVQSTLERIAEDEEKHFAEGCARLQRAYESDPEGTMARMDFANERVARALAEWIKPEDCAPICSVCGKVGGGCAKADLAKVDLDMTEVMAAFADRYGEALRHADLPTWAVTRWLARLVS
jgi:fatty aldehyde decarbonylase